MCAVRCVFVHTHMRIRMRSDENGNKAAREKNGPDIYFIYKQKYSFKLFSYLNIHKYYCSVLWSESVCTIDVEFGKIPFCMPCLVELKAILDSKRRIPPPLLNHHFLLWWPSPLFWLHVRFFHFLWLFLILFNILLSQNIRNETKKSRNLKLKSNRHRGLRSNIYRNNLLAVPDSSLG